MRVDRFHFMHHKNTDEVCRRCCNPYEPAYNSPALCHIVEREEVDQAEVDLAPEEYSGSIGHRYVILEGSKKIYMREVYREEPEVNDLI